MPDSITLQDITYFLKPMANVRISMLRLDMLDPVISGNKYFKLKYNLKAASAAGYHQLITFGGAYSNHLIAAAAAANKSGMSIIGIVRGFHGQYPLTPTLEACAQYGMQLHFVNRDDYQCKNDPDFLQGLQARFGDAFIIPEGGDNDLGRLGCEEIAAFMPNDVTHVCLPVGTGTTFAGLRNGLDNSIAITGFPAIKNAQYLEKEIRQHLRNPEREHWNLEYDFHFGGFAKIKEELVQFMRNFYQQTQIKLDIVYTAKMMFGINALIAAGKMPAKGHIVAIHTGGIQGNPPFLFQP